MKKKLVSILLSGALLASSLLATFTVVAAGNTAPVGETAVPAVTAAPAEETAAPAEAAPAEVAAPEAAPAEVAAPVTAAAPEAATVAADVPMSIAEGTTKTVEKDGSKYQVTIAQDFENYTSVTPDEKGNMANWGNQYFPTYIVDNGIGNSKSLQLKGSDIIGDLTDVNNPNVYTRINIKLDATQLSGEGLYFEVYSTVPVYAGYGTANRYVEIAKTTRTVATNITDSEWKKHSPFQFQDSDIADISPTEPLKFFYPWSDFGISNVDTYNQTNGSYVYVQLSWNYQNFSGKYKTTDNDIFQVDNIGFYSQAPDVKAVSSYTTYQNPLTSESDAKLGSNTTCFDVNVAEGTATFTINDPDASNWHSNIFVAVDGSKLTEQSHVICKFTKGNGLTCPNWNVKLYNDANAQVSSYTGNNLLISWDQDNATVDYDLSDSRLTNGDLSTVKWLQIGFGEGTGNHPVGGTITVNELYVVETDTGTFDPETSIVNVNPVVENNGELDVMVTENGGHDINWTNKTGVSLQVKEGAQITLTAHPDLGMETVWTGIPRQVGEVKQDSVTFTVSGDAEIAPVATFNQLPGITIRATSEEDVEIIVAAGRQSAKSTLSGIAKNAEVTLTADATSGTKQFSCWKHGDNIISYEHEMKVLAKDTTAYTAVYADEPQEATSTLTFYSITKDSAESKVVAVFEWHLTSGDVKDKHIGDVKLNITGHKDGEDKTFDAFEIEKQNGYYTLTITFTGGIPDDLTFTITLDGIDSNVTATSTVDMISGI